MGLGFEIISSPEKLVALTDEIEANVRKFPGSFFYSPCWLRTFQTVLSQDKKLVHIIGRDEAGALRGTVHFSLVRTSFLKLSHPQVLALMGTRSVVSPEHLEFPIDPAVRDDWLRFLESYIKDRMRECAFAVFDCVAENAGNIEACLNHLRSSGFRISRELQNICPYFDLPETFDELMERYSANMRKIIRRSLKRGQDTFRFTDHKSIGGIETVFAEARRLHNLSREQKSEIGSFDRAGYVDFHHELVRCLGDTDQVYFRFLLAGDRPVAFRYGFLVDGIYYDYQTGYDPAYAHGRPGFVILAMVVRDLISRGAKQFDFLRGDEDYKRHWADKEHKTYRYFIFPPGLKSHIYSAIWRLYHGLK